MKTLAAFVFSLLPLSASADVTRIQCWFDGGTLMVDTVVSHVYGWASTAAIPGCLPQDIEEERLTHPERTACMMEFTTPNNLALRVYARNCFQFTGRAPTTLLPSTCEASATPWTPIREPYFACRSLTAR